MNGVSLFTRQVGTGPDVVVLHGGPGAHHDYLLPQFDSLAAGRRLRYYDQRGGGRSPVARHVPVDWSSHVADLHALLAHWDLGPVTVLGYSWGGLLALLSTLEHPEDVGRLALVSPAPITAAGRRAFEERFHERMQSPDLREARAALVASDLRITDPDRYRQRTFELAVAGYFADISAVHGLTPFRVTERTQRAVWRSLGEYDLSDRLHAIACPTRVFHGRHDPIPLETASQTARLLNADLEVFEHSGHCPYVEEPQRFVDAVGRWLPRVA